MFAAVWLSTLVTLLPTAAPGPENDTVVADGRTSLGTKPLRLREMFTFTNSTLRLRESFRPVSSDTGLSLSSKPARRTHLSRVSHFLLRAASFGYRRFLGSDVRRISKFFAIGMTSATATVSGCVHGVHVCNYFVFNIIIFGSLFNIPSL